MLEKTIREKYYKVVLYLREILLILIQLFLVPRFMTVIRMIKLVLICQRFSSITWVSLFVMHSPETQGFEPSTKMKMGKE
jgi:hypothetical protein